MKLITVKSPAKLNLYLNLLGKRSDGYHNIETVFESIDLCDELTLKEISKGIELIHNNHLPPHQLQYNNRLFRNWCGGVLPEGRENLVYRAAELVLEMTNYRKGVRIIIDKRIPVGAGLGGGSSNAASVIEGLNRLWKLGLSDEQLFTLAGQLGSDAPFFLLKKSFAIGRERGDDLHSLDSSLSLWHVLIFPNFSISTQEAYRKIRFSSGMEDFSLTINENCINNIIYAITSSDISLLGKSLFNIFETWAYVRFPILGIMKTALIEGGACGGLMSGTGSTVYGIVKTEDEAIQLRDTISAQFDDCRIIISKTGSFAK